MKKILSNEIFKGLSLFLLLVLGLYLAYEIKGIIISVLIAFIINAGLRPLINYLENRGFARGSAIALTYLAGLLITIILSVVIVNTAVNEVRLFFTNIDDKLLATERIVDNYAPFLNDYIDFEGLKEAATTGNSVNLSAITSNQLYSGILENLSFVGGQGIGIISKIFGGLLSAFAIIMMSIYMLTNRKSAYEDVVELTPKKYQNKLLPILKKMEASLGSWVVGQLALMFMIGFATFIIIILPRLIDPSYTVANYALIIAIIAGILEGVPNLGPIITMVLAILIALISGAGIGIIIYIVIAFILLQQLEGILLVPMVMKRAVNLNPILSIAGVLAGFQLGGPLGALLSVPIIAMAQIAVEEISQQWKKEEN